MDVIASKLEQEAEARQTGVDKVKSLLGRINWLRAAKLAGGSGLALAMGLPPVGLFGDLWKLVRKADGDGVDEQWIAEAEEHANLASKAAVDLVKRSPPTSPPKEIQAVRDAFEDVLAEMGVTLVVLIDDLDRCLPETTISTLEAVRLFLFLKNTAFVVAADNDMIRHAVRCHFAGVENESLVTSYFDKLIQVPIRVPPLGTQDVRAYMMLLFVDNSELDDAVKEKIRDGVCDRLRNSWRGERVDRKFIRVAARSAAGRTRGQAGHGERLAPLMAGALGITGNPRLVKRFLNALSDRMAISRAQGVDVDEAVLAKLLLFERLAEPEAYAELAAAANLHEEGRPELLSEWEANPEPATRRKPDGVRDDDFVREWLRLPPRLAESDLRGALYVSREHTPLLTADERLSSEGAELLAAMLSEPEESQALSERLKQLPRADADLMMGRLLDRARREQRWGTPPILDACLALAVAVPGEAQRLADFLADRPPEQLEPDIVPKIGDHSGRQRVRPLVEHAEGWIGEEGHQNGLGCFKGGEEVASWALLNLVPGREAVCHWCPPWADEPDVADPGEPPEEAPSGQGPPDGATAPARAGSTLRGVPDGPRLLRHLRRPGGSTAFARGVHAARLRGSGQPIALLRRHREDRRRAWRHPLRRSRRRRRRGTPSSPRPIGTRSHRRGRRRGAADRRHTRRRSRACRHRRRATAPLKKFPAQTYWS